MSDTISPSRRTFVAAAGAAAAGASAVPAAAQQRAGGELTDPARNPYEAYPRPPFPVQQQPWPGLQSKMTPRPDCGERSYRGHGLLAGRRALITGGDSGIGRAVAIAFAREGADVAINYLPQEEPDAREVVQLIRDAGREEFDDVYKTNVYAMFRITKAALPHLRAGASIIYTSSEQAYDPDPYILHYASTKAAIANFTKGLAKNLAKQGIRVNAIAPGPIWTPLQVTGGTAPAKIPQFGTTVALGRAGQPVELAPSFVALATAENTYATGQIYGVNGGKGVPG